jgi:hypothetical protein
MYYQHNFFGVWLIGAIIGIIPFWRICTRVGYSPWLSLLVAIPLVNIIFIYFLAFSTWPSRQGTVAAGGA